MNNTLLTGVVYVDSEPSAESLGLGICGPAEELYLILIISFIVLTIVLIHYFYVVYPNKTLILYRIRRPNFLLSFLIACSLSITTRSIIALLQIHNTFPDNRYYKILQLINCNFLFLMFCSVKMWLLFYDIKTSKYRQNNLILKMLNDNTKNNIILTSSSAAAADESKSQSSLPWSSSVTASSASSASPDPHWLYEKYSYVFGSPQSLLICNAIFMIIWTTIIVVLDIFIFNITEYLMKGNFLLFFFIYFILVLETVILKYIMGCNSKKKQITLKQMLNDYWCLGYEIVFLLIVFTIIIFINFLKMNDPVLFGWIGLFWQITNMSITLFTPYAVLIKIRKAKQIKEIPKKFHKNIFDILATKKGFCAFSNHCVNELNIQNLTFFVQVWQYKYQDKHQLIDNDNDNDESYYSNINGAGRHGHGHGHGSILTNSTLTYSTIPSSSYSESLRQHNVLKQIEKLPWADIPLSQFIISHPNNKLTQCKYLYDKYINENAYYALNISSSVYDNITFELKKYQRQAKNKKANSEDVEAQINYQLLRLFDEALNEVMDDLQDSVNRFTKTQQFRFLFL